MAHLRFAMAAAILAAGCFSDLSPGADASAARDATPSEDASPKDRAEPVDVPDVAPVVDAAGPTDATTADDAPVDAPVDAGPCARDEDCIDPRARVCDVAAGRCVACLPARDTCPADQHCDATARVCVPGCRADEGCAAVGDGGVRRCDTARHACVECAADVDCPAMTICAMGACVPGCNAQRGCPAGETCCEGACADLLTSASHCGSCGRPCRFDHAAATCAAAACELGACDPGFANCDGNVGNGCETETRGDVANCGACGNRCATPANAFAATCAAGRCGYTCAPNFADCNGAAEDGCEVDLRTSIRGCGRCETVCATGPRAPTATCSEGRCGLRCEAGWGDCDGDLGNGCEADTRTSVAHCGACGSACPEGPRGRRSCVAGRCAIACDAGFGDCDGDLGNGCETALGSTVAHCGACGRACSAPGGTPSCVGGVCAVAACGATFSDCDGRADNGCESDTRRDPANCGRCGAQCPTQPNTVARCDSGVCGSACAVGFGDCDGNPNNGCETDLRTTNGHCGACGRTCATPRGTAVCRAGACAVGSCQAGWGDCDGSATNGCETDLATSPGNCGACGARPGEVCDGRDNTCDGRVDEGCPTSLENLDTITHTSPTFGTRNGTNFAMLCPAGSFVRGMYGRVSSYLTQVGVQCARPRLVEDRSVIPYRYTVALDAVTAPAPGGVATGTAWTFTCPGDGLVGRVDGRTSGSVVTQLSFDCFDLAVTGSPTTGFRVIRTLTAESPLFGPTNGTAFTWDCPGAAGTSSLREVFGSFLRLGIGSLVYVSSLGFRCTQPTIGVR